MNFETFASSILAIHIYYILCSTFYMQYKSEVPDDDKTIKVKNFSWSSRNYSPPHDLSIQFWN